MENKDNRKTVLAILKSKKFRQPELFLDAVKEFGAEHLCRQMLDKLELGEYFTFLGMLDEQTKKALISIACKAIYSASEYKTFQIIEKNSELSACFGYEKKITHKQFYSVSDMLYKHKSSIDKYMYNRITDSLQIKK